MWESGGLQKVSEEYADRDVRVVRVSSNEKREKVSSFVKDTGATFPVLLDMDSTISEQFGIKYFPTTVIIGKDGKVRHVAGLLPEEDLRTVVDAILRRDGQ